MGGKIERQSEWKMIATLQIAPDIIEKLRANTEVKLFSKLKKDGFRDGKVPADIARAEIGEFAIWEEMSREALASEYIKLLQDEEITPLTQPAIKVKNIAPGQELVAEVEILVMPEIKLPDYKKIAGTFKKEKDPKEMEVSDKDLAETMKHLQKMRAQILWAEKNPDAQKLRDLNDFPDDELPELTDEWVASFSQHKTLSDFRDALRENIKKEKELKAEQKRVQGIMDEIVAQMDLSIPDEFVNYELGKMWEQLDHDLSHVGRSRADYLKEIGKDEEALVAEWTTQAQKNAKLQIIFQTIARQENISIDDKMVETELTEMIKHYKHSHNTDLQPDHVRQHIAISMTNRAVVDFLSNL